ncbi:hypothetical protein CIPAW_12G052200 [Carya illinoinensis]|uniref:Uncharacterized protein n=1 Tax=Carya illinoinensis TaxID=32201 RepID=A0A8T1NVW5_CARIL|nr:hypothetical protein CIPAW_12G052200 [Carya illinoinensis]
MGKIADNSTIVFDYCSKNITLVIAGQKFLVRTNNLPEQHDNGCAFR